MQTLKEVGLWDLVAGRGGLKVKMEDLGLSEGERRIFGLERGLLRALRGAKVVVLDEVMSGYVYPQTLPYPPNLYVFFLSPNSRSFFTFPPHKPTSTQD